MDILRSYDIKDFITELPIESVQDELVTHLRVFFSSGPYDTLCKNRMPGTLS
jgi:hypothetical protein